MSNGSIILDGPERRVAGTAGMRLTALITGATDGIGEAVACRLAGIVDTLLIHGRCPQLLGALAANLAPANPGTSIVPIVADLSSFAEVRRVAESVRRTFDHLDILVNNAATAGQFPHALTEDGNELTFQVNYLSPVLLEAELFEMLRVARHGRVVNVVCEIYRQVKTLGQDYSNRRYHPLSAYAQSKFALAVHTASLARSLSGGPCTAVCIDPGAADTKLRRKSLVLPGGAVAEAADNILYAVTMRPSPYRFHMQAKQFVLPEPEVLQIRLQHELETITEELLGRRMPWLAPSGADTPSMCR